MSLVLNPKMKEEFKEVMVMFEEAGEELEMENDKLHSEKMYNVHSIQ